MSKFSIAYAMNKKKPKKMADGGDVSGAQSVQDSMRKAFNFPKPKYAEGGKVEDNSDADDDLVMRIMRKRYSKGGQVANQEHGENNNDLAGFSDNEFDDLVLDDNLESHYGDDDNAGDDLGNKQEDEDRKDIVARILKSGKKKDKLPRPA